MEKLFVSAAYRYVALALMLAEANHAIEKLEIPGWKQVAAADVVSYHVSPPRLSPGGSVDTATHIFGFGRNGQLQFIQMKEPDSNLSLEERHRKWAGMKSLVDTNTAYVLASNWLTKLDVDVTKLQNTYPVQVVQEYYFSGGLQAKETKVMLPRYEVRWGTNETEPAVWISIFGPTKQPIHIRQTDSSFSHRPHGITKDPEKLLAIKDDEFARYTLTQRSNLVVESAPSSYSTFQLPVPPRRQASTLQPEQKPQRELRTLPPREAK